MAAVDNDIIIGNLQALFKERDSLKLFLEELLKSVMQAELTEHIKAEPYNRGDSRCGHRNGYKSRRLSTRVGQLELEIPQARGCRPYQPSMFSKYQRSERALLCACAEMYFQGVSTRKVQEVLDEMCATKISSTTVSRVSSELDEKLLTFCGRTLAFQEYPFLQIDARYEKIRVDNKIVSQAVLVVAGFTITGRREILDWRIADSESQDSWGQLLKDLKDRGLYGVEMITSDAHGGIRAAIEKHFQGVAWQRCRVHFKRELASRLPHTKRREILGELAAVYRPTDKMKCAALGRELAEKYRRSVPAIARIIDEGLEDTLSVLEYPYDVRLKMASTNMLENIMKRLKARTKVVTIFPNRQSCWRLVGAQLMELHENWLCEEPPYMPKLKNYYEDAKHDRFYPGLASQTLTS